MNRLYILVLTLVSTFISSCKDPKTDPVVEANTFTGKWGNDYIACGYERTEKQGIGDSTRRKEEELWLTFSDNNQGVFNFYDCESKRRFPEGIPFIYSINGDKMTLHWQGTEDELQIFRSTFNRRDTFRFEWRQDTLYFTDGLMSNTMYRGASYFIRRK